MCGERWKVMRWTFHEGRPVVIMETIIILTAKLSHSRCGIVKWYVVDVWTQGWIRQASRRSMVNEERKREKESRITWTGERRPIKYKRLVGNKKNNKRRRTVDWGNKKLIILNDGKLQGWADSSPECRILSGFKIKPTENRKVDLKKTQTTVKSHNDNTTFEYC